MTFESPVETQDEAGQPVGSWVAAFPLPISAEIIPIFGADLIAAQAVQSKVTTRIIVRYRPGIVASMRVIHRQTIYNIEAVIPDSNSGLEFVTLLCSSGVNEG